MDSGKKVKKVSPLKPKRNVSNGITSSYPMFPKFTFAPNNLKLINYETFI